MTIFAALHQFFLKFLLKWQQNSFCKIQDGGSLKFEKNVQRPNIGIPIN
jgi:hypothetical protein